MFFSVFGGAWLVLWASAEFTRPGWPIAAIALATAGLLAASVRVYRHHKPALAAVAQSPEERRRSHAFGFINGAQWALIALLVFALARSGPQAYIVPGIVLIVGLHFIPMALVFSYRPHFVTGAALTLWPLLYVPLAGPASGIGPLGAGIVLWCSAAWAIRPPASPVERAA
jgi:hypothetical protein